MQQLSMTDAFMLAVETDKQKLQMASVSILALPANNCQRLTRKRLRDHIAKRIDLAPVPATWSRSSTLWPPSPSR
jgi:hypothetical protein